MYVCTRYFGLKYIYVLNNRTVNKMLQTNSKGPLSGKSKDKERTDETVLLHSLIGTSFNRLQKQ